MGNSQSGVTMREITKAFGSVRALDNVSLDVKPGELVALLGPSGCGKTTLLRSVAGLETPDSGTITVGGRNMNGVPTRNRPIGMVFQSYALFPNMTIRQNIDFPLKVRKAPAEHRSYRVAEMLELVGLTPQAERYPHQVSGGQQQRGALARALAPAPDVLLLDEPLSALDAQVRTRLRDEIRRIQQVVNITTLYVTHDQSEAMAIADRVAVMNLGQLEQVAQPAEMYDTPTTRFSAGFVGNRNAVELPVVDGAIAFGEAFRMPVPGGGGGGARAIAFFRPEDVTIEANGGGQAATVESKLFLGSLTRIYLLAEIAAQSARIYVDLPSRQALPLTVGDAVSISIDPEHVTIFPLDD